MRVVEEEKKLLLTVSKALDENPIIVMASEDDTISELLKLREDLPNAKEEDKGALIAQYNYQIALLDQIRAARDVPQVNPDCPYFGHLRLNEEGDKRNLCIGKATRIDGGLRIIDWRNAPISKVFYKYRAGEEYEEEIGDRVRNGVVEARRTVGIVRGELRRVQSDEGSFFKDNESGEWSMVSPGQTRLAGGEGCTARAHDVGDGHGRRMGTDQFGHISRRDKHLPDIAGLLDEDQFELITQPSSGFVVIRGTAGSGKTTVALHRIAWLSFQDPAFDSAETMFLVFSKALRDYVSHVLPALDVHRVKVSCFADWAREQRRKCLPKLPKRVRDEAPAIVTRIKLHGAMDVALKRHQLMHDLPPTSDSVIDDWSSTITDAQGILSAIDEVEPGAFTMEQVQRMTDWCREQVDEINSYMDGDKEAQAALDAEDDALLLRAWQGRVGPLRGKKGRLLRYKHIALDEVQDFSTLEVSILLDCLDDGQCITLAGDTMQAISNSGGTTSWTEFFSKLGVEGSSVSTLRVSYRCSHQVASFSRLLLGEMTADDVAPITLRDGPEVELFRFTDQGAVVAFLADALRDLVRDEPHASIAVLTPGPSVSRMIYSGLCRSEIKNLRHITDSEFLFEPGIDVTEVEQVKGLEFDYVVVVEANAGYYPDTDLARRILHVACTRALHQLWITSVGTPSPIIREAFEAQGQ